MEFVFELTEELENCAYAKFLKLLPDGMGKFDLGIIEQDEKGDDVFVAKYGNAVLPISKVKDFQVPEESNDL